jgi:hypothetical protein
MDSLITYDEVAALIANPPSIAPRPNFTNLRNLRHHLQHALKRLSCPQSNIHGWAGLIMARPMYDLLTTMPFRVPIDPGPVAIYYPPPVAILDINGNPVLNANGNPTFVTQPTIGRPEQATIDARFNRARNYYLSYMNIRCACYNILDNNIDDAFKVLDNPALVGWNPSMELRKIFDQMTSTYRRPNPAALLQNDTLFRSVYSPQDAPEVLFRRSKDCQEVQILGNDPYMPQQMLNNAVCLLLHCGLYTRDFDDWDCNPAVKKIWTNLKTFIQEAYTRCLNATSIKAGSQGYVQNAFNILQESDDEDDDDVNRVITQMATLTTQIQLMATTAAETSALVMAAINQLAANQQAMQQQFAAFATQRNTTYQQVPTAQPHVAGITIPAFSTFHTERHG